MDVEVLGCIAVDGKKQKRRRRSGCAGSIINGSAERQRGAGAAGQAPTGWRLCRLHAFAVVPPSLATSCPALQYKSRKRGKCRTAQQSHPSHLDPPYAMFVCCDLDMFKLPPFASPLHPISTPISARTWRNPFGWAVAFFQSEWPFPVVENGPSRLVGLRDGPIHALSMS